jgi:hypothetical protein
MDRSHFPWQPLGTLLVDEGLVSAADVQQALLEQRRSGRLLGEIVVHRGYVSGADLARALAKQHSVELRTATDTEPPAAQQDPAPKPAPSVAPDQTWRPLGRLLIEEGFLTARALQEALEAQAESPDRRLGEIMVERGLISGRGLALALAEQHGVTVLAEEFGHNVEAVITRPMSGEPKYELWDVVYHPAYQRRKILFETTNFLEAADFACDLVDREQPEALEIQRTDGTVSETVWTYSQQRADAAAAARGVA